MNRRAFAVLIIILCTTNIRSIDQAELRLFSLLQPDMDYLTPFSVDNYTVCTVEGQGKFYVDKPKDMVKKFLARGLGWEMGFIPIINTYVKPGTVAIDIGAHIGTHTINMAKAVQDGMIISFEPQQKIFRELVLNLKLNNISNVIPARVALGNHNGMVKINTIGSPNNEGGSFISNVGEPVRIMKLDDLHLENVSFIKIDAENTEEAVLDGAFNTIARNKPALLIEILGNHEKAAEDKINQGIIRKEIIKKIESFGYHIGRALESSNFLFLPN